MTAPSHSSAQKYSDHVLRVSVHASCAAAHAPFIRRNIIRAHEMLKPALAELSIALVGDRKMSKLHKDYLDIPGPTDVLTFPLEVDSEGKLKSGEVVICVPEARRRCRDHGVSLRHELLLYALHGLLHLCGYDDITNHGFEIMHRREDDLLSRLGIGPVFQLPLPDTSPAKPRRRSRRLG